MSVGIIDIEIYVPKFLVNQGDLEIVDKCQGKYTVGLGQTQMAIPASVEDAVSMALTAADRLMRRRGLSFGAIGRLDVGTESSVDLSKSIKSFVLKLFECARNFSIEGADNINACYGGTAALFNTVNWIQSNSWDGRLGLVIATDIAIYSNNEPSARATGGAGAVCFLVGPNPVLEIENFKGNFNSNNFDFYKPLNLNHPLVDGKLSLFLYIKSLICCYFDLCQKIHKNINNNLNNSKCSNLSCLSNILNSNIKNNQNINDKNSDCNINSEFSNSNIQNNKQNSNFITKNCNYCCNSNFNIQNSDDNRNSNISQNYDISNIDCSNNYDYLTFSNFFDYFTHFAFHSPYTKLAQKAFMYLKYFITKNKFDSISQSDFITYIEDLLMNSNQKPRIDFEKSLNEKFNDFVKLRFDPSLELSKIIGNCYTASVFICLISVLSKNSVENLVGKRIALYSYGSGSISSLYSIKISQNVGLVQELVKNIQKQISCFERRTTITPEKMFEMAEVRFDADRFKNAVNGENDLSYLLFDNTFYLESIDDKSRRFYKLYEDIQKN